MRISEARSLHLKDLTADGLISRESKFHKSRLLAMQDGAVVFWKITVAAEASELSAELAYTTRCFSGLLFTLSNPV
jgi:hypothetical protein